jgi:hypothetical protein
MFGSLRVMADWLVEVRLTIAAMESTSTYWKPPFSTTPPGSNRWWKSCQGWVHALGGSEFQESRPMPSGER